MQPFRFDAAPRNRLVAASMQLPADLLQQRGLCRSIVIFCLVTAAPALVRLLPACLDAFGAW
jgi:hypothetical protein